MTRLRQWIRLARLKTALYRRHVHDAALRVYVRYLLWRRDRLRRKHLVYESRQFQRGEDP